MRNNHRITMLGRATADAEMRYTPAGVAVTNVNLAFEVGKIKKEGHPECPSGWKDGYARDGGESKYWVLSAFAKITFWRKLAETANQYITKGKQILIEAELAGEAVNGILNPRVWQARDGTSRASYEFTATSLTLLGGGGGNGYVPEEPLQTSSPEEEPIPF